MLSKALQGAAVAAQPGAYIEDVFSTYLYTGNASVQTINNGIALGSAYGGSVYFNGSNSRFNVPSSTNLQLSGDFTIETWVNTGSTADMILGSSTVDSNTQLFRINQTTAGNLGCYLNGTTVFAATAAGITTGSWFHLALCRSGTNTRMFVNGTQVGSTNTTWSGTFTPNAVGALFLSGAASSNYFNGLVSNLRIIKGSALYTSNFTPSTTPLTAITNTQLLIAQSPSPLTDYSANSFTVTNVLSIAQNGGGPFTDSTANKGGLVWLKGRSGATDHALYDTVRGATKDLVSNSTAAETTQSTGLNAFNSNGFSIGALAKLNTNAATYASWTFRKQAKFFDIVTWTGNGVSRAITHNLGSTPGCIIIKRRDAVSNAGWVVWHRSIGADNLTLNTTEAAGNTFANQVTSVTSTSFTIGTTPDTNNNGGTYVAYLFAHDAGGFGASGTDNVISCGSFTANAATVTTTLNYEPQLLLFKKSSATGNWRVVDNMRGFPASGNPQELNPNLSAAETSNGGVNLISTGFTSNINDGGTYIYIAIRRGPMRTPTSGTSVYGTTLRTVNSATFTVANSFPLDLLMLGIRNNAYGKHITHDRLRDANQYLSSSSTAAEASASAASVTVNFTNAQTGVSITDNNGSWGGNGGSAGDTGNLAVYHFFRRAPGFFDVVCYTGNGVGGRTISHNLGAIPQLMIFKSRSSVTNWAVGGAVFPDSTGDYLTLNAVDALNNSSIWNYTSPTSTTLTVGNASQVNTNAATYVAYLFATVTGVSKVFSFTGNGSSQTINCGFTAGARFVMIKRTDSTGDWYIWDSSRGIVSGNDPHLSLNTTAAEVTTDDTIDPDNSGFIVNQVTATNVNVNNATYIGLAIA